MLLKRRVPRIDADPATPTKGFEHLDQRAVAVLRWLNTNRVEYVLVGAVARAARGKPEAGGPVAIVAAPYRRNLERLARALRAMYARLRVDGAEEGQPETWPVKVSAEKLARGQRWMLRCGGYDLDIEGRPDAAPGYQELLYEANRIEIANAVSAEVASPEDIERYDYIRRTGTAPEIRISRQARVEHDN